MRRLLFAALGLLALGGLATPVTAWTGLSWNDKPGPLQLRVVTNAQGKVNPYGDDLDALLLLAVGYWNESPNVQLAVEYVTDCPTRANNVIVVCVGPSLNGGDFTQYNLKGGKSIGGAFILIDERALVSDIEGGHHEWRFCHELGHGLGLQHPDPANDSCLSQGWHPNQADFDRLALMYGGTR